MNIQCCFFCNGIFRMQINCGFNIYIADVIVIVALEHLLIGTTDPSLGH